MSDEKRGQVIMFPIVPFKRADEQSFPVEVLDGIDNARDIDDLDSMIDVGDDFFDDDPELEAFVNRNTLAAKFVGLVIGGTLAGTLIAHVAFYLLTQ